MTALAGATVLVTGGAGTIGSTLVDQLLDADVAQVRCSTTWSGPRGHLRDVLDAAWSTDPRRHPRP